MVHSSMLASLVWATGLGLVSSSPTPMVPVLETRTLPGQTVSDTMKGLARGLSKVRVKGRDISFQSNKTVLDTSWNGAVLYKDATNGTVNGKDDKAGKFTAEVGVEIQCKTCYLKGAASASFTVKGNASEIFTAYIDQVQDVAENITEGVFDQIGLAAKQTFGNIISDGLDIDDFVMPTLNVSLDIDLPPLPSVDIKFEFDAGLELYVELGVKLHAGATYSLNLFSSNTPIGVALGPDILAGVAVTVDLILDIQAAIEITSGFHLKVDKPLGMELTMFSTNLSHIDFPGGQFEFLPVTLVSDSAVLKGVLRVALRAGLAYKTPKLNSVFIPDKLEEKLTFGAGVAVSVFANMAEFVTNVTGPSISTSDDAATKQKCDLEVVEVYKFALGIAAGATINAGTHTWGPTPNTSIDIFYKTLGAICATRGTPAASSATTDLAVLVGRQAPLTTTTLTSTGTFTGQTCASSGLVNCPASLQASSTFKSVFTLVTAVAQGVTPTFPATQIASVASAIPFGSAANAISSAIGTPTEFVPPVVNSGFPNLPDPSQIAADVRSWLERDTNGVSNKIILGVSVGLGVPVLIMLISCLVYVFISPLFSPEEVMLTVCRMCCRRRRYNPVPTQPPVPNQTIINVGAPAAVPPPMPYKQPLVSAQEQHSNSNSDHNSY
ncbi:hypothetical protein B0T26DRAFT_640423 [Lasiosphaeria miniovina]|uniref:Mid2 domain-containing protein n=1 Tax=Lasiosphaeria miniovina TaxID=1954250 RepID=A0AA40AWW0_9PEZI|nr:uncharacterized protein B0T26DRAFT_640423 [Lasiosphaeria miniovina]KAK0723490.1 hypothetical protein B0T26DRAFT_640423 [Lasiosphaeria miniovina]